MKVTINEKLLHIVDKADWVTQKVFNEAAVEIAPADLASADLSGVIVIKQAPLESLELLVKIIEVRKMKKLNTVYFLVDDVETAKTFLKSLFKIVKAAGGLVTKRDKVLMIFRLGRWDLPKGKLNRNEKSREAAKREVEEECSITVEVHEKLCTTWHGFVLDGNWALKKTTWYKMKCINDAFMTPQKEEGIEDIRWMSSDELEKALQNTYRNIREVIDAFRQKEKSLL
jgi:8-oxo-dGTP pyrophosphatase MutT (NUDIX family)